MAKLTKHAALRSDQRGISSDEIALLEFIGADFQQKGGTTLISPAKKEKARWLAAIDHVIALVQQYKNTQIEGEYIKRKIKALKRLRKRLQGKALPFLVVNPSKDLVVTCGHQYRRLNKNY